MKHCIVIAALLGTLRADAVLATNNTHNVLANNQSEVHQTLNL